MTTILTNFFSRISKWLNRSCSTLYASQVKEDIPHGLRSYMLALRLTGIWPTTNDPRWYKWLTIAAFLYVGITFPLSLFVNIFFGDSIQVAMEGSFLSLNSWVTTFKAIVIYWRRDHIRELFRMQADLVRDAGRNSGINERVARMNIWGHVALTLIYSMPTISGVAQTIVAKPGDGMMSSTAHYPYDFAQQRSVYLTLLVYQSVGAVGFYVWISVTDAFFIAMIHTVCGHFAELKESLRQLGTDNDDVQFYKQLVECCKRYENSLSYARGVSDIMSLTFVVQFGMSGVVLCSSVYILSVNNPMDNPLKFFGVTSYTMCIVVQIFFMSFVGSRLTTESDGITSAIYESQWIDRNEKCKLAYRILVERSMRPMTIFAGGLFELSLPTFVRICRAAYSYFNVLRTMDSKTN